MRLIKWSLISFLFAVKAYAENPRERYDFRFSYKFPLTWDNTIQFGIGTALRSAKWEESIGASYIYDDYYAFIITVVNGNLVAYSPHVNIDRYCIYYTISKPRKKQRKLSVRMEPELELGVNNIRITYPSNRFLNRTISLVAYYGPIIRYNMSKRISIQLTAKFGVGYGLKVINEFDLINEWSRRIFTPNNFISISVHI